jgi:mannose-6-phosphate isomerase-like protein (cupin superfamily)
MNEQYHYVQQMDIRYGHLERIDIPEIVVNCKEKWFNQSLTRINDSVARIGIVQGEYHWHKHDNDDEFFFVLEGKLFIDLEDKTVELGPMQGMTVTKAVMHRTRAIEKTVMLMIETVAIDPIGD